MKTAKIVGIFLAAVIMLVIMLETFHVHWRSVFYWPYAAFWMAVFFIHLVSAVALFRNIRGRHSRQCPTFLSLDAPYWAMVGFAFGVLGLFAHWFFNDYLRINGYLPQTGSAENTEKPPGDEREP